jgi:hypothetical protein
MAARAILAVTLFLMLVAGNIAWPAAASGPLCTLACCADRAPHAAGSCMHDSCETGVSTNKQASDNAQHSHHHHEQQQQTADSDYDAPQGFAGAMVSAGGSDIEQVPTIDAVPYPAPTDNRGNAGASETEQNRTAVSATALAKPCQSDCGVCASGLAAPKRSRNSAALAGANNFQPLSTVRLAVGPHSPARMRSAFIRQYVPRGPPTSFS